MSDAARLHALLHGLWSTAAGEVGYSKPAWKALEAVVCASSGYTCSALGLFADLRRVAVAAESYDATRWDELEQLIFHSGRA